MTQAPTAPTINCKTIVSETITGLVRAIRNMGFYAADHPAVTEALAEAAEAMNAYLAQGAGELELKLVEGEVVVDDRPVREASGAIASLAGACRRREIDSLTVLRGVQPSELAALVTLLSMDPTELAHAGGASRLLARQGVSHLRAERLKRVDDDVAGTQAAPAASQAYQSALDVVRGIVGQARTGSSIDVNGADEMVQDLIDLIVREQSEMLGLISVKNYDEYTFTHGLHICILSIAMGCAISLDKSLLKDLGVSALLHDVGKIQVPLEILRKPGALTDDEFALVQRHPIDGALILAAQEGIPDVAPVVAFEHHLQPDLRGYPKLSRPRELNFFSLIVSIADVYDALTTQRPYRPAVAPHEGLSIMHSGGAGSFEPRLLARFTEILGRHPAGALLRLDDGSMAVVSRSNPRDPARPLVRRVIHDDGRQLLDPQELDLAGSPDAEGGPPPGVADVLDPGAASVDVARLLRESPHPRRP